MMPPAKTNRKKKKDRAGANRTAIQITTFAEALAATRNGYVPHTFFPRGEPLPCPDNPNDPDGKYQIAWRAGKAEVQKWIDAVGWFPVPTSFM